MRILVTGVEGFTGRYVAAALAKRGHVVLGLGQPGHAGASPVPNVARLVRADLGDAQAMAGAVSMLAPHAVIHLAAIAHVTHGDVGEMMRTNVDGTRNLLEALDRSDFARSRVILASSANIYGNAKDGVLDENTPPNPANDYGRSKIAMESMAHEFAQRLKIVIVRPFNYTGVGQHPSFVVPKIVDHIRRRADIIELGNLDVARDFSDVRAVADVYARLIDAPELKGNTFNICSGVATPLGELLELAMRVSGHSIKVVVNPAFVRADEIKSLCGSRKRLEAAIGFLDMPPIEETIQWMIEG
jgi:GDP-6-deoxy-D-talose 4-dehydrogenase